MGHEDDAARVTGNDAVALSGTVSGLAAAGEDRPDRVPGGTGAARVPWAAVGVYIAVSFGAAWLVALPLWLKDPSEPGYAALFQALAGAMMLTPTLAMLVVVFAMRVPRGSRARFLGLWPLRPAKRVVWFLVLAWLAPIVLVAATLAVAALCGWVKLDLQHFSGYQQIIDGQLATLGGQTADTARAAMPPTAVLALIQFVAIPFLGLANLLPALGEELGWRGWLLPALRPLGMWPSLLLSGAIWGLWHSPVILLGYNFNRTDAWGVVLMAAGCAAWGVFFGWLRLRSASVWPAALAHGVLNASASVMFVTLLAADQQPNMALVNPLGVPGWIVLAIVVGVLALAGQFHREPELSPKRARPAPSTPVPGAGH